MEKESYYNKRRIPPAAEMQLFWKEFHGCKKVLDLGCGVGRFGEFKLAGVEVYGVDIDSGAVKIAKKHEKTVVADLEKPLPFPDGTFDGILAKDILEHVREPWKVVAELKRVLKKGGIIIATVPSPTKKAWDDYTHIRPFTKRSIRELFLDQGLQVAYAKPIRGVPLAGVLGLTNAVSIALRVPVVHLLTQGWKVKAVKPKL
jgi:SAM-dependent methyltransferase